MSETVGNAAAMRDACVNIAGYAQTAKCHTEDGHVLGYLDQIEKWAKAALAAPSRQCDVGTAEEQVRRYKLFCENHSGWNKCEFFWAQTPYEAQEGEGK